MPTKDEPCAAPCSYDAREAERLNPKPNEKDRFTSTRSNESDDAHRDMDGFDVNEELARLRSHLLHCAEDRTLSAMHQAFIAVEMMSNIDEYLVRGGPLPKAWAERASDKT